MAHISTDHHGRFVFSASYNQGCVSVTPLHDGLPGETITVVEGLEGCHSANISPDNRTLWVPALKQDRICLFTLSDDGFLSAQEPAEVTTVEGAGPRHMVFHPNQQYGYCVNELNSSIDVWELKDPKGNIECVQTLDMMPPDFSGVRWAARTLFDWGFDNFKKITASSDTISSYFSGSNYYQSAVYSRYPENFSLSASTLTIPNHANVSDITLAVNENYTPEEIDNAYTTGIRFKYGDNTVATSLLTFSKGTASHLLNNLK